MGWSETQEHLEPWSACMTQTTRKTEAARSTCRAHTCKLARVGVCVIFLVDVICVMLFVLIALVDVVPAADTILATIFNNGSCTLHRISRWNTIADRESLPSPTCPRIWWNLYIHNLILYQVTATRASPQSSRSSARRHSHSTVNCMFRTITSLVLSFQTHETSAVQPAARFLGANRSVTTFSNTGIHHEFFGLDNSKPLFHTCLLRHRQLSSLPACQSTLAFSFHLSARADSWFRLARDFNFRLHLVARFAIFHFVLLSHVNSLCCMFVCSGSKEINCQSLIFVSLHHLHFWLWSCHFRLFLRSHLGAVDKNVACHRSLQHHCAVLCHGAIFHNVVICSWGWTGFSVVSFFFCSISSTASLFRVLQNYYVVQSVNSGVDTHAPLRGPWFVRDCWLIIESRVLSLSHATSLRVCWWLLSLSCPACGRPHAFEFFELVLHLVEASSERLHFCNCLSSDLASCLVVSGHSSTQTCVHWSTGLHVRFASITSGTFSSLHPALSMCFALGFTLVDWRSGLSAFHLCPSCI